MNWLQPLAMPDIFYAAFSKKTYASLKSVRMRGGGIQESHLTPFCLTEERNIFFYSILTQPYRHVFVNLIQTHW